ncbi:MAG: 3-dehydroquinate synthase [Thermoleophilia bacterium]|nr:3-dehydroquinate synthase [Thermoleophilia bacterium]
MAPFVALTGFMGSGKTSVGAETAMLLGWDFVDLDAQFVRTEGSISDFFAARGEAAFRQREGDLLRKIIEEEEHDRGLVLALGGGTLAAPGVGALLADKGGLVLLAVTLEEAWQRVKNSDRPLAGDLNTFRGLFEQRHDVYEAAADWVLPVEGRTVRALAEDVASLVVTAGDRWSTLWGRRLCNTERPSLIIGGEGARAILESKAHSVRARGGRVFVVTDGNVMDAWGDEVLRMAGDTARESVLVVEPGETSKDVRTLERTWEWLARQGARRDDVVVALGGGVVGDLAGFAAATYQRGVPLWQIPTSLLAQVDSSVGGKTAVNLGAGKNLVGAFYQPDIVLSDPSVLVTLPKREYVSGLGEVVKHALLLSEEAFGLLETETPRVIDRDPRVVGRLVKMSIGYKAGVVSEDERESGRRAVLNLGHTLGHALEVVLGYGALSHGEAVSLGLLVALAVSEPLLGLDPAVRKRTEALLSHLGLPTTIDVPPIESLLTAAAHDKKARAGSMGFVGLKTFGEPVWGMDVPHDEIERALEVIRA